MRPMRHGSPAIQLLASTVPPGGGASGGSGGTPAPGAPPGYPNLVFAATPQLGDTTWNAYLSRTGMIQDFGESPPGSSTYEIGSINGELAMKIGATAATHGANAGFRYKDMPANSILGGPPRGFTRIKIWWPVGFSFIAANPASGTKAAGPWGGQIPATGSQYQNPGFATRIWTGTSSSFVSIGFDVNNPRAEGNFAASVPWRNPLNTGSTWLISNNQGRWVQLEWEIGIETVAGGTGLFNFWIDGVLGLVRTDLRYFDPSVWNAGAGIKGIYLSNWWGGGGTAPVTTPIYYKEIELWAP